MMRKISQIALALILSIVLTSCYRAPPNFNGSDITGANFGRDFKLTDTEGRDRTLAEFRGKYVVLFFGFANCPAVCPTTLQQLAMARKALGDDASHVQVIFVTLDPERDSAEILKKYTSYFDPSFIALRGDVEATQVVGKEFHVFFQKIPMDGAYIIEHTAMLYVLDSQGRMRLSISAEMPADKIGEDIKTLMNIS